MAQLMFHNDTVSVNNLWYESHKNLITSVCMELGMVDKSNEFVEKFLGTPLKIKAKKDPNKPKRAKSAYLFFCDDKRPALLNNLRKKKQKVVLADISRMLGKLWNDCNDIKRQVYIELSTKDKQRYEEAMEAYSN
uniref:HMG box domain-containing protein n=1 Tax=viral metagenome TaxID=1070528 RepID=A0A6C0BYF1_9ZZZZ